MKSPVTISSKIEPGEGTVVIGTHQVAHTINNYNNYPQPTTTAHDKSNEKEFIWNIPSPSSSYVKREKLLPLAQDLVAQESGKKYAMVVIAGSPGVGKSQAACYYAAQHKTEIDESKKYPGGGFLLDAENASTLFESYRKLAVYLNLLAPTKIGDPKFNTTDQYELIHRIQEKLLTRSRMLFIFDNAPDINNIEKFLPITDENFIKPLHHIIVTSNNSSWENSKVVHLNNYSKEEAMEYVKQAFNQHNMPLPLDDLIEELTTTLFNYPLALSQAIKTLENDHFLTVSGYINDFKEQSKNSESKFVNQSSLDDSAKTLLTTWQLALDSIRKIKSEFAQQFNDFFEIMTCFKRDKVPLDFFYVYFKIKFKWNKEQVLEFFNICSKRYLLEPSNLMTDKDSITLHLALYSVLKFQYKETLPSMRINLIDFIANHLSYNQFDESSVNIWLLMHKHIEDIINTRNSLKDPSSIVLKLTIDLIGYYIYEHTNYPLGVKMCGELSDELIKKLPTNYQGRYYLYRLTCNTSNHKDSKEKLIENLNEISRFFKEDKILENTLFRVTLGNLKSVYFSLWGDPNMALLASKTAISLLLEHLNKIDLNKNFGHSRLYIKVFFSNAKILLEYGKYTETIKLLEPVLDFITKQKDEFSDYYFNYYYIAALMFIAQANTQLGNYEHAKKYYSKCKDLLYNNRVLRSQWILRSKGQYYMNVGCLHYLQGKNNISYYYHKLAQSTLDKIYNTTPDIAVMENLFNMIEAKIAADNNINLNEDINKAAQMWDTFFEKDHQNLTKAKLLLFQGWYQHKQNSPINAYEFLNKSVEIFKKYHPEKNRYYGAALFLLADLSTRESKYKNAINYLKVSIETLPKNSIMHKQAEQKLTEVQENRLLLNLILAGFLIFMCIICTYYFNQDDTKKIKLK